MPITDKNELRSLYSEIRASVTVNEKAEFDRRILTGLINFGLYLKSNLIMTYVSVNNEIDTFGILSYALRDGKRVFVPLCAEKTLLFYEINSVDELIIGAFGIPTADVADKQPLTDFGNALCIVPALSVDRDGSRIGYGGGYYDRFLAENHVKTIGLCYERCLGNNLPVKEHDVCLDYVLTENRFIKSHNFKQREVSTYG